MVDPRARCTHEGGGSQRDRSAMKRWFRESRLLYENKFGTRFGYGLYRALRVRGAAPAYDPALRS